MEMSSLLTPNMSTAPDNSLHVIITTDKNIP